MRLTKEKRRGNYFWGGLCAKETPFSMLPFKPSTQAFRRVFSFSSRLVSGLWAFSAPLAFRIVSMGARCDLKWSTYTKLDRNGEEVKASLLSNGVAAWNTWEVDERWLDDALLAAKTLEDLLCESVDRQLNSSS
jgi:hypothetical protein